MKKGSTWYRCRWRFGEGKAQCTRVEDRGEARQSQGGERVVVLIMGQEGAPNHSGGGVGGEGAAD